jgi:PAS domain S-box-containing protein
MLTQLLNPENYVFTIHAAASMLVGTAIAVLGIYVLMREHGSRIGVFFWLFTVCISIWLISFGMDYASLQPGPSLYWIRFSQMCVAFIPVAVLALTVAMVQRARQFRTLVRISMVLSSLFCIGVAATNLHIKGLYHYSWGYFPEYGPLGVIFLTYFFGIMIFVLYLCWMEYRRTTNARHKKRMKGMAAAFSIGYLGSLDFIAAFGVPLYPFGYLFIVPFLLIAAYVITRYRLVDITQELAAGQILETMKGAVIVVNLEDKIRIINKAAQTMLDYQNRELLDRDLASVIELPAKLRDCRSVRDGNVLGHEMNWISKNGRSTCVDISASVVTDRDASPVGIVYVAHDITERKKAEDQLKTYSEDLAAVNEEMKNFAYIVSHDLRAPLVNIKGFSDELDRSIKALTSLLEKQAGRVDANEKQKTEALLKKDIPEALGFIGSSVTRMDALINSILKLSRLGRNELKPELIHTEDIVRALLNSLAHQIDMHKAAVTIGPLPDLIIDKTAAEQIFGNLLDNALKYLEPSRPGKIEITAKENAGDIQFMVRDNGRGIAKEDTQKAFELFRRVGRQDVPGEGMGLTYVNTLVRRLGGRIWCESEPGVGSAFLFTIPAPGQANK